MGRLQRQFLVQQDYYQSTAIGATNAQTLMTMLAPSGGARIIRWNATQLDSQAGDTGTFTILIEEQGGTDLCPAITIDPDAATNTTVQGLGNGTAVSADGVQIAFKTTKTGTVATGVKLAIGVLWQM
jgi:hypothetical protein